MTTTSPRFSIYATGSRGEAVVREVLSLVDAANIDEIVTAVDPGSKDDKSEAIARLARGAGVHCRDRLELSSNEGPDAWRLVVGWRHMLVPTPRTIVLHDSMLPRYRGFAPVVAALIAGEKKLGATAFFASERYDEGDVIFQHEWPIEHPMTIARAFEIVAGLYVMLAQEIVFRLLDGRQLPRWPQNHDEATYTIWRDSIDYYLDWRLSSPRLLRTVYALGDPYEGAKIVARFPRGTRLHGVVREASLAPDVFFEGPRPIGKVLFRENGAPVVVCGQGLLRLDRIAFEDGSSALGSDFRVRFLLPEDHAL